MLFNDELAKEGNLGVSCYTCTLCVRACCSQITVQSVEEIELLKEEVMSSPVLLRVWAEYVNNDYIGAAHPGPQFEGDLSLSVWHFVNTRHVL